MLKLVLFKKKKNTELRISQVMRGLLNIQLASD